MPVIPQVEQPGANSQCVAGEGTAPLQVYWALEELSKAIEEKLLDRAEEQGNEVLRVIEFMANGFGWEAKIQPLSQEGIRSIGD